MSIKNEDASLPPGFHLKHVLQGSRSAINRLTWSPTGWMLAATSINGDNLIWDADTGILIQVFGGYTQGWDVTWLHNGRLLASTSSRYIDIWDVNTSPRELFRTLQGHKGPVYAIACSPDGSSLASGGKDSDIHLWCPTTLRDPRILKGSTGSVLDVTWSPDGRWLASGSSDSIVTIWDAETGEISSIYEGHSKPVYTVAWSPDGRWLASGSADSAIYIWSVASGKPTRVLEGHTNTITCIDISFDGRLLASKGMDGTIRIWDCERWQTVATLNESVSETRFQGLAFHPTEPILATLRAPNKT